MIAARAQRCNGCPLAGADVAIRCPFESESRHAGAHLFDESRPPEVVYLVRRGIVLLTDHASGERLLTLRGPGSTVGIELLVGQAPPRSAVTITDSQLCAAPPSRLQAWAGSSLPAARGVLALAVGEAVQLGRERRILIGTTVSRVARFLLAHAHGAPHLATAPMHMDRDLLAGALAMRPETLSRALAKLRREGAIELGRELRIADERRLRAIGEGGADEGPELPPAFFGE